MASKMGNLTVNLYPMFEAEIMVQHIAHGLKPQILIEFSQNETHIPNIEISGTGFNSPEELAMVLESIAQEVRSGAATEKGAHDDND